MKLYSALLAFGFLATGNFAYSGVTYTISYPDKTEKKFEAKGENTQLTLKNSQYSCSISAKDITQVKGRKLIGVILACSSPSGTEGVNMFSVPISCLNDEDKETTIQVIDAKEVKGKIEQKQHTIVVNCH